MLFELETDKQVIRRQPSKTLADIGWQESHLQELLFKNLEKVLEDNELLLIMQSRSWQEEPDLMALNQSGDLYIFELKAWEAASFNLLQALRYGQIYGQYDYDRLNDIYKKTFPGGDELLDTLNEKFSVELQHSDINQKQHFVVITNGLDFRTREAILYWRSQGLDITGWVYRIYTVGSKTLFEMNTFEIAENPYSDVSEGYFILNTNISTSEDHDSDMVGNGKAAAYFDPWKRNIEKLRHGNVVFLYRSGQGIVGMGVASGKVEMRDYEGDPNRRNEEYFQKLNNYHKLRAPLSASKIKELTGVNYVFMSTMFNVDAESGHRIESYIKDNLL